MALNPPDMISELLRGMRLSGVNYRRFEASAPFGVSFGDVPGKAQFHFVSRGPAILRMQSGARFSLNAGDAVFIPHGEAHALLSDESAVVTPITDFPSEPICNQVQDIHCQGCPDSENVVIFTGCMNFDLGGMQPLVKAMPEVMMVSSLMSARPEIQPLLAAMERESLSRQVGFAGILARLADVVAALIVRGWVENGCGKGTGWIQVLRDPRLSRAIYAMHEQPGVNWSVADLAKEAGTTPAKYLGELRMRLAMQYIGQEQQAIETVALRLGYGSVAAFSRAFKRVVGHSPGTLRDVSLSSQEA